VHALIDARLAESLRSIIILVLRIKISSSWSRKAFAFAVVDYSRARWDNCNGQALLFLVRHHQN